MTGPRKKRDVPQTERVVRRAPAERKRLPKDLEAFAKSDSLRFRPEREPERTRLRDPRAVAMVPGVANRDARKLADARVEALIALIDTGANGAEQVEFELAHAVRMGLWRGRSLTGFEALAENVLGLTTEDARARAERGAARAGMSNETASEEAIAIAWRTEVALLEAGLPGRVRIGKSAAGDTIELTLPVEHAPESLGVIAERMIPLVRDREQQR
jgi:hypothetical protein